MLIYFQVAHRILLRKKFEKKKRMYVKSTETKISNFKHSKNQRLSFEMVCKKVYGQKRC